MFKPANLKTRSRHSKVLIIGGGISGLSVAYGLEKKGIHATVLEKSDRAGGVLRSERTPEGFLIEHGAHSMSDKPWETRALFKNLDLLDQRIEVNQLAKKRYVLKGGSLHEIPSSASKLLLSSHLSTSSKLRLALEYFIPRGKLESESVADFAKRRFGKGFYENVIGPMVSGIYAGDPESLSLRHAFPKIHQWEQNYGSIIRAVLSQSGFAKPVSISFKDGMESLPKAILKKFTLDQIYYKTKIQSIDLNAKKIDYISEGQPYQISFDIIVFAIPTHAMRDLPMTPSGLFNFANQVRYPSLSLAYFGFRKKDVGHPLDGFGYLLSQTEHSDAIGALFTSTMFPGRAPSDCVGLTAFIGGARFEEQADAPNALDQALESMRSVLKIEGKPIFKRIKRWSKSHPIVHFGLDHEQAVLDPLRTLKDRFPHAYFVGNYLHSPCVCECLLQGIHESHLIADELDQIYWENANPSKAS